MKRFAILLLGLYCATSCLRGHYEQYLVMPMWIQYIWVGKSMIPIIHPAIYGSRYVCDECAPEEKK